MERNKFGINPDREVAFESSWELDDLYVSCHDESFRQLKEWLTKGDGPLMLGGQIGCGKSALALKAFGETGVEPDITLRFDREGLNLSTGDFLRIILKDFCELALKHKFDLSYFSLPQELGGLDKDDWPFFLDKLSFDPDKSSIESFRELIEFGERLADDIERLRKVLQVIGGNIETKLNRPLFIFASGIDKYDTESPAWAMLKDLTDILFPYKTLFEVNAVHLFDLSGAFPEVGKLFLHSVSDEKIEEILKKRLGFHDATSQEAVDFFSKKYSGGNPRQAIRLLAHFEAAAKNKENTVPDSVFEAKRLTSQDFFTYGLKPDSAIVSYMKKKREITTPLLAISGDKDTARLALHGNWFFIAGDPEGENWPVKLNPLVKHYFNWDESD